MDKTISAIYKNYSDFKEQSLFGLQVKHEQLLPLLEKAGSWNGIVVEEIGKSFKGKAIHKISIGSGKIKILAWCQMHGNEATATKAIFDLINVVLESQKEVNTLLEKICLTIIPMLNPDGADSFTRHNAQGIDINRDAASRQSPESRILMKLFEDLSPDYCLNLHDQRSWYNVGKSSLPATLSFLAPAYNAENEISEGRLKAMNVIAEITNDVIEEFDIGISRYSDSFEERAFGDYFQANGVPTILFEAGGYKDDWHREYVRGVYFYALLSCLFCIGGNSFKDTGQESYFDIPISEENYFEWIIRNVEILDEGRLWTADVGGRREFQGSVMGKGVIEEIGDLRSFSAYNEIDGSGYLLVKGKTCDESQFNNEGSEELISKGFTTVSLDSRPEEWTGEINYQLLSNPQKLLPGYPANLLLLKGDSIEKVILNGFILNPSQKPFSYYYGVSLD